jgi:hypothetical protein
MIGESRSYRALTKGESMKRTHIALAALAVIACVFAAGGRTLAVAASPGTPEYVVIQWDGMKKTQVIWPDGHVEFLSTLLPGIARPSDDVHERGYVMTQLINKIAKQGYEYVGMASGVEIVMKKLH